jgi:2-polyprenyl-6-methoxyphenol hydroxylase-like FAD-dependent oxidoreductase
MKPRLLTHIGNPLKAGVAKLQRFGLSTTSTSTIQTPVLIVGGGPTGLLLANLLQAYQTPFCLVEALTPEQRFQHPQAHFLNTRTMEIMKHSFPSIYREMQRQMQPVEEWKRFHFGPTMRLTDRTMACVVHPVDRPLEAYQDANGKLLIGYDGCDQTAQPFTSSIPLSDCSVGHLAQHTFCRILYRAAVAPQQQQQHQQSTTSKSSIDYGNRVDKVIRDDNDLYPWRVETSNNITYQAQVLIAADGANSSLRSEMLDISMKGTNTLQHLVNVHFELQDDSSVIPAMLYTVFHPKLLAMVVRHAPGDYVMQIPYFPPYQTLDEDFSLSKVKSLVRVAVGEDLSFRIKSIKTWTMGSLVAERYYKDRVFLTGDAAHVFPPAGGFGMNTGLQDVYSLAWRLAHALQDKNSSTTNKAKGPVPSFPQIGRIYQQERQPVASRNAALSVRNYQRVIGATKSCYLNDQHPIALLATLNASSFVPFSVRRTMFQSLLQTAMWPLSLLQDPTNVYAKHVTQNLQKLLGSGQGLPLLFPNSEIGFCYSASSNDHEEDVTDWKNDTMAGAPKLAQGYLFPHLLAHISQDALERFDNLSFVEDDKGRKVSPQITTRDLPAQLATDSNPYGFVVLEIRRSFCRPLKQGPLYDIGKMLQHEFAIPCAIVELVVMEEEGDIQEDGNHAPSLLESHDVEISQDQSLLLRVEESQWKSLRMDKEKLPILVAIRPDGHVASIVQNGDASATRDQLLKDIRQCLGYE